MASELMEDWLECEWERRPGALSKSGSMLKTVHFVAISPIELEKRNKTTDLVIIPSGVTTQLQPLDMSINKPLKHLVLKHLMPG
jgi:hypothetical protein